MSFVYTSTGNSLLALVRALLGTPTILGIATYVLTALALYTIAKRRGLRNPWLAWIPVASSYLLGSLSDQYHYVVNGENKCKRKILLVLEILNIALGIALAVVLAASLMPVIGGVVCGMPVEHLLGQILGLLCSTLGLCLPLLAVSIAASVFRYMALYDVYRSTDPANSVLFLVLSILFGVTEPFFLFFSRNKDDGMPPRKQPVVDTPSSNDWVDVQEDEL